MLKKLLQPGILALCALAIAACASSAPSGDAGAIPLGDAAPETVATGTAAPVSGEFGDVSGKIWKLAEIRKSGAVTAINRQKFAADGFGDFFSVTFGEQVSGQAAPNRYSGPYQVGSNNALTIGLLVSTRMASFYDPGPLQEHDYFGYLSNVKSWKLNQGKLELYSSGSDGKETVLVYAN
jgi:heat shock protein HslJ